MSKKEPRCESQVAVPVVLAHTKPYRFVHYRDWDKYTPTLDEINSLSFNHVKLHRNTTAIDIGLPQPFNMMVGFDGSLSLPAIKEFLDPACAARKLNSALGKLCLGGVFYRSISPEDLCLGLAYEHGYIRVLGPPTSGESKIQYTIKNKLCSTFEAIRLYKVESIHAWDLQRAYKFGADICDDIAQFRPELFLEGCDAFVENNWNEALLDFWVCSEQLINYLWIKDVIQNAKEDEDTEVIGRIKFLRDHRSWTASTMSEMLFQIQSISSNTYNLLNKARKSRNGFVHSGDDLEKDHAVDSLRALMSLFTDIYPDLGEQISATVLMINEREKNSRRILDGVEQPKISASQGSLWMKGPPPIPGEREWEGYYEVLVPLLPVKH